MTALQEHYARLSRLTTEAARLADDLEAAYKATPCRCGGECPRCRSLELACQTADELFVDLDALAALALQAANAPAIEQECG